MKITQSEFETCLGDVPFPLAVATSGGADSLALLLLTHTYAQQQGGRVVALTVDHGLRTSSKEEALEIQQWAHGKGIEHVILEWEGEKPSSRLQEKAREARYHLLINWCKNNNISTLLLGHHQQDQEETFWLRLSSGSGLDGLSGMKKRLVRDSIILVRPFLGFSKERLKATLIADNQSWIEDASNQSAQFFRGRLRSLLKEEGLSASRLHHVMEKLRVDADFIHDSLQTAIQTTVQICAGGYISLQKKSFEKLHPALAKRLLSFLMQWFSGSDYPPRSKHVAVIMEKIKTSSPFTVGGIYWIPRCQEIHLFREIAAIKEEIFLADLRQKTLWDNRFWIDPKLKKYIPRETYIAPLGYMPSLKKEIISSIPSHARATLPALWIKGKVVIIPHLGYSIAKCEMDLEKFIYLKPLFHDSLRFTI